MIIFLLSIQIIGYILLILCNPLSNAYKTVFVGILLCVWLLEIYASDYIEQSFKHVVILCFLVFCYDYRVDKLNKHIKQLDEQILEQSYNGARMVLGVNSRYFFINNDSLYWEVVRNMI